MVVVAAIRDVAFILTAEREDPKIVARSCRLTVVAIGVICLATGLAAPLAVPLLFGKKFAPAVWMVEVLLLGTMGRAVTTCNRSCTYDNRQNLVAVGNPPRRSAHDGNPAFRPGTGVGRNGGGLGHHAHVCRSRFCLADHLC